MAQRLGRHESRQLQTSEVSFVHEIDLAGSERLEVMRFVNIEHQDIVVAFFPLTRPCRVHALFNFGLRVDTEAKILAVCFIVKLDGPFGPPRVRSTFCLNSSMSNGLRVLVIVICDTLGHHYPKELLS